MCSVFTAFLLRKPWAHEKHQEEDE
jgi:hypothetical protein